MRLINSQINMTRCNTRDEFFYRSTKQLLPLMDIVLDSAGETNAKDNSRKKLNTNQTTIKTDHCE